MMKGKARTGAGLAVLLLIVLAGAGAWLWTRSGAPTVKRAVLISRQPYTFNEELPVKSVRAAPRVNIVAGRGNVSVVAADALELRVAATKIAYARNPEAAQAAAARALISVTDNADGSYQVQTSGEEALGEQGALSIQVQVPRKTILNSTTGTGDVRVAGILGGVVAETGSGAINIRDSGGAISVNQTQGDVHVVGASGDVKVTGRGNELEIADVTGQVTVEAPFFASMHLARIAGALRLLSARVDLNISRLDGTVESTMEDIKILNVSGNISLRAQDCEVHIENPGGRIEIAGYGADMHLQYSRPPREDLAINSRSADISVSLPAGSSFQLNAQTMDGNLNSDFTGLTPGGDPEDNNLLLYGQVGRRGPSLQIHSEFGDINIRKAGS